MRLVARCSIGSVTSEGAGSIRGPTPFALKLLKLTISADWSGVASQTIGGRPSIGQVVPSAAVYGDINGDGKADFSVQLDHVASLVASDFIL